MKSSLIRELKDFVNETDRLYGEYKAAAKSKFDDFDFLCGYYLGRAGAYAVCREYLKELIANEEEGR